MQPGFQALYCIRKLQINGIAHYYVLGEETSINLNMLVNRSIRAKQEGMHCLEFVVVRTFTLVVCNSRARCLSILLPIIEDKVANLEENLTTWVL